MRFIKCCNQRQEVRRGESNVAIVMVAGVIRLHMGVLLKVVLTVVKPEILFLRRLDWMMAISSTTRLLVSKSWVRRP